MNSFSGTLRLARLALRRDRIKLTIWLVAVIGLVAVMVPSLQETYGHPEQREVYASTMSSSMVGRMFGGVLDGDSLGAILMVETYLFIAVIIAFMNTLLVVRHTRQNEEAGSTELLQSARVGRNAPLSAALLIASGTNIIIVISTGLILSTFQNLTTSGNWLLAILLGCVGMAFAAIGAITAQLSESARGANMLASLAIGIMFLLRAIGDGFAHTVNGVVSSAWPSWLSALGWGQLAYPYTRQHWWIVGLYGVFTFSALGAAYYMLAHRDVGSGILPARKGPNRAKASLLSTAGLTWRLQRGVFITWVIVVVALGILYGSMSQQFKDLMSSSEVLQQYVAALGGESSIVEAFLAAMIAVTAIVAVAYVVQILQRLRTEETSYHLEALLGTGVSRVRWLGNYIAVAMLGSIVLMIVLGLSTGMAAAVATHSSFTTVWPYVWGSLVYLPAIGIFAGIAVLCFGLIPRAVIALSWSAMTFALLISQLGALLKLPHWALQLSPFSHVPAVPSEAMNWVPFVLLLAVSVGLMFGGLISFRHRDITTT